MHLNRHQNFSHKKRREQMMLKRAVKRGDVPAPPPSRPDRRVRKPRNARNDDPSADIQAEAARRLQSAFIKLPPQFVKDTEILSATLPLTRPIPPEAAILADVDQRSNAVGGPSSLEEGLSCPRRPEWNYDMTKDELEANEEARFQQWLAQSDAVAHAWCNTDSTTDSNTEDREPEQMPHAPTTFERNLEVWRQLWRVTETSQILLILLDSRCPTLHFPPALVSYLASPSIASRLRVILVLTKVDIAGPERAAAWTRHLKARYPGVRVVQVESFAEKEPDGNDSKKRQYEPHLPPAFRQALVDALRETHAELLEPLEEVKSDPGRLAQWKPHVRSHVDWDTVLSARGGQADSSAKSGGAYPDSHPSEEHSDEKTEPDILTIGLIGQPNVGKSSLLNAMFGTYKVKASRQPGKTKHFQTLFWTPEVRLVDCPGLIFPNYVPMETQILTGILPISRVSAIPLTIHHAAQLIPLEKVLDLEHPSLAEPPAEDKRTWRAGMHPRSAAEQLQKRQTPWTAMDIMTAYASKKNWITARVGRPDVKRAGNAILRALAEGRIRWAFWPPGTEAHTISTHEPADGGAGIWLGYDPARAAAGHDVYDIDGESDDDGRDAHLPPAGRHSDDSEDAETGSSELGEDLDSEDADEDADVNAGAADHTSSEVISAVNKRGSTASRFDALVLDDVDEEA